MAFLTGMIAKGSMILCRMLSSWLSWSSLWLAWKTTAMMSVGTMATVLVTQDRFQGAIWKFRKPDITN